MRDTAVARHNRLPDLILVLENKGVCGTSFWTVLQGQIAKEAKHRADADVWYAQTRKCRSNGDEFAEQAAEFAEDAERTAEQYRGCINKQMGDYGFVLTTVREIAPQFEYILPLPSWDVLKTIDPQTAAAKCMQARRGMPRVLNGQADSDGLVTLEDLGRAIGVSAKRLHNLKIKWADWPEPSVSHGGGTWDQYSYAAVRPILVGHRPKYSARLPEQFGDFQKVLAAV